MWSLSSCHVLHLINQVHLKLVCDKAVKWVGCVFVCVFGVPSMPAACLGAGWFVLKCQREATACKSKFNALGEALSHS